MNKENLEELPKFPCENISELKTLLFLKSKYLKKFNFEDVLTDDWEVME